MVLTSLQVKNINTFSLESLDSFVFYKKVAILGEYLDFTNVFLEKLAIELPN